MWNQIFQTAIAKSVPKINSFEWKRTESNRLRIYILFGICCICWHVYFTHKITPFYHQSLIEFNIENDSTEHTFHTATINNWWLWKFYTLIAEKRRARAKSMPFREWMSESLVWLSFFACQHQQSIEKGITQYKSKHPNRLQCLQEHHTHTNANTLCQSVRVCDGNAIKIKMF